MYRKAHKNRAWTYNLTLVKLQSQLWPSHTYERDWGRQNHGPCIGECTELPVDSAESTTVLHVYRLTSVYRLTNRSDINSENIIYKHNMYQHQGQAWLELHSPSVQDINLSRVCSSFCCQFCCTALPRFRENPWCALHGLQEQEFKIRKNRLQLSLLTQRKESLPQVLALCKNRKRMARTVTLKAGTQSVHMFAVNLLQTTGERFLQPLLQAPDMHGCATISLLECDVPALVKAFQILDHGGIPHTVSEPEYLKLMLTFSSCNAWSVLAALTSSLFSEASVNSSGYPECIPVPVLKSSL